MHQKMEIRNEKHKKDVPESLLRTAIINNGFAFFPFAKNRQKPRKVRK